MLKNKKVEQLEQEVEDLHRRLAEKDEQLANQLGTIIAQRKAYDSLKIAYDLLLKKQQRDTTSTSENERYAETKLI